MGFDGYLNFGGIEIINAARTTAYLRNLLPTFPNARITDIYDTLPTALGDEPYRTPLLDDAPWIESSPQPTDLGVLADDFVNPTHGFYGLYPLGISGIGDSTMTAKITQSILDGGYPGQERDTTRSIRVRGYLVGENMLSVEAGLTWLRNALRRNGCQTHGDQCGYSDLSFFLAPPDLCVPTYTNGIANGTSDELAGPLDASNSPLNTADGRFFPDGQRVVWTWDLTMLDGVIVRWGAELVDGSIPESHGPIYLRRSNYIVNPKFAIGTSNWETTGADLTSESGSGGTFGAVRQSVTPPDVRYNFAPDPSFENGDPNDLGWRGSADVQSVTDGTAPQGTKVATVAADPDGSWIEFTALGPLEEEMCKLSWWVFQGPSGNSYNLTIHDQDGNETYSNGHGPVTTGTWDRIEFNNLPVRRGYTVRITTEGDDELRVDGFLLEVGGGPADAYFDGDTASGGGFNYDFIGGPSGYSRGVDGAWDPLSVASDLGQAVSGEAIFSVDLRALGSTVVDLRLYDPDDNLIVSQVVNPSADWNRFALGVNAGSIARVELASSSGEWDLTNAMFEPGATLVPYFDGDSTEPSDDYSIYWEGGPNASISRYDYIGSFRVERSDGWRPFLYVDQGYIPAVYYDAAFTAEVPLEFQLRPYARSYHKVSCTVGVKEIAEYTFAQGAALEVDFILTAGNPHAYTTYSEELFPTYPPPESVIYSDYVQNLAINPSPQEDANGYEVTTGSGSRTAAAGVDGDYGYVMTWGAANLTSDIHGISFGRAANDDIVVVPGQMLYPSAYVKCSASHTLCFRIVWWDASGVQIGTATNQTTTIAVTGGGAFVRLVGDAIVAPANAHRLTLRVVNPLAATVPWVNGQTLTIDHVQAATSPHTYFDGALASSATEDYQWVNGDAYDSVSVAVPIEEDLDALVVDPDLPVLPAPPIPPSIPDLAIDETQLTWRRYYFDISAAEVPLWANTIPTLTFYTKTDAIRQLRVRFHPNPFDWDATDVDPTSYCGEFILSYLPANSTLTVTGVSEDAWASVAGSAPVTANHLLYGTDGSPMEWPALSCNIPYVMTIDVPPDLDEANLEYAVVINRQE